MSSANQARHRTRPRAFRSMSFEDSSMYFALHPRRRAGSVRLGRSAEITNARNT